MLGYLPLDLWPFKTRVLWWQLFNCIKTNSSATMFKQAMFKLQYWNCCVKAVESGKSTKAHWHYLLLSRQSWHHTRLLGKKKKSWRMIVTGYFGSSSNISLELGWLDIIIYSIWTEKMMVSVHYFARLDLSGVLSLMGLLWWLILIHNKLCIVTPHKWIW